MKDKEKIAKLVKNKMIEVYHNCSLQSLLLEDEIIAKYKKEYERRYYNQIAMESMLVIDINEGELTDVQNKVKDLIRKEVWEKGKNLPDMFYNSFHKNKHPEMLTQYSTYEFKNMDLYLVKGYNIGYAIKDGDEIVALHNSSNVVGIADELIKSAIKNKGKRIDHFDGQLTGIYEKAGFKETERFPFNKEFAPENWKYKLIDILDRNQSVYADELNKLLKTYNFKTLPDYYKMAIERYKKGMPDIIFRKLR